MRKAMLGFLWVVPALALAAEQGAAPSGGDWPVLSGSAVGRGHFALHLQAGWPDAALAGLWGSSDRLDLGARIALGYGQDGSLGVGPAGAFGFRLQAVARHELLRAGAVRLGGSFSPGFGIDYPAGLVTPRILLPLELTAGLAAGDALAVHLALELPVYITPGTFGGLTVPILLGGGAEYRLDRALSATGRVRAGPALELTRNAATRFALELAFGLAYRM